MVSHTLGKEVEDRILARGGDYLIDARRTAASRFFNIQEIDFRVTLPDGTLSSAVTHEVIKPRDAAAVIAYHPGLDRLVLIRQFRPATARDAPGDGWLVEVPAGGIASGETARQAARREFSEETGYSLTDPDPAKDLAQLDRFEPIATLHPTPGLSTERITLFYLELKPDEKPRDNFAPPQGEVIVPFLVTPSELFNGVDAGAFTDAKLLVAASWFRTIGLKRPRPAVATERDRFVYCLRSDPKLRFGVRLGDIGDVKDVDVWVNSENTDMLMDRWFGKSVSAKIRRLGAEKYPDGAIYRDTIADAIRARLGGEIFVRPAAIVVTEAGELREANNVKKLFHAAAVQGRPGRGIMADAQVSAECVSNALLELERRNKNRWFGKALTSIIFPLLGAGEGGKPVDELVEAMVPAAVECTRQCPATELKHVWFLAYTLEAQRALKNALDQNPYLKGER